MNDNDIKEELSKNFIRTLGCFKGYKIETKIQDDGVDLNVVRVDKYTQNGTPHFIDNGKYLDIQLKATTEKSIKEDTNYISYTLKSKNYNDLIHRKNAGNTPLILIILILPENKSHWVELTGEMLLIRKCAYWYFPQTDTHTTENKSTQVINIPKGNLLDINFFDTVFENQNIWNS